MGVMYELYSPYYSLPSTNEIRKWKRTWIPTYVCTYTCVYIYICVCVYVYMRILCISTCVCASHSFHGTDGDRGLGVKWVEEYKHNAVIIQGREP